MFEIYAAHYDGTSRSRFETDLEAKHLVLTVHSSDNVIQGFTTLLVLDDVFAGSPLRAIYSGDTIIDRAYWGSQVLAFNWIRLAGAIKAEAPDIPLYWFLIVKGHRTYRYLSAFSKIFYPHWERRTPAEMQALMDHLASERFPGSYRAEPGIIHFPETHGHLKSGLAEVTASEAARADVAYFLARNPGYRIGDELVCLTELNPANLTALARQQFLLGFGS
ncbi:MAG TPA: hypothetical protein VM659_03320 [Dongiaceae bacterium]|nr:hypothetical protein [Dongiaceae bacterium]